MRNYFLFALALVAGCDLVDGVVPSPRVCTGEARAGLSVTPIDAASNSVILAAARVVARDGTYADSTTHATPPYSLAHERPGKYSVSVEIPGYQKWQVDGVVVRRDECHVITIPLAARLNRIL